MATDSVPDFAAQRADMVEMQIAGRGIEDPAVLAAMATVPRETFVEPDDRPFAYDDRPLRIAAGQTISQPYIVALMAAAASLRPGDRVLEVGAGSGYASAVLSRIAGQVYAIERHATLADLARRRIAALGYRNVEIRVGDGVDGWPEAAPFDAIIVSARGDQVPPALRAQLCRGGRLVMPVGRHGGPQTLIRIVRSADGEDRVEDLGPVSFVPLVGGLPVPDRRS